MYTSRYRPPKSRKKTLRPILREPKASQGQKKKKRRRRPKRKEEEEMRWEEERGSGGSGRRRRTRRRRRSYNKGKVREEEGEIHFQSALKRREGRTWGEIRIKCMQEAFLTFFPSEVLGWRFRACLVLNYAHTRVQHMSEESKKRTRFFSLSGDLDFQGGTG